MVESNDPGNAVIDFTPSDASDLVGTYTGSMMYNGTDWLTVKRDTGKLADPEEIYQKSAKDNPKILKSEHFGESHLRKMAKNIALRKNLDNSAQYLSVTDVAKVSISQDRKLIFKRGSLVYLIEGIMYYRKNDVVI